MYNYNSEYEYFIYDFDKTIATIPIDWINARMQFKKFSMKYYDYEFKDDLRVDQMELILFREFSNDMDEILNFRRKLESSYMQGFVPNLDIINTINECQGDSIIISNNLRSTIITVLKSMKLYDKIKCIIGIDTYYAPKPLTRSWKELKNLFPVNGSNTLFIGDSPETDGHFARNAGIQYFQIN